MIQLLKLSLLEQILDTLLALQQFLVGLGRATVLGLDYV
jgi:hypothetical protein